MGCCNKAPKGGTTNLGLLLKLVVGMAAFLFLIVALFG